MTVALAAVSALLAVALAGVGLLYTRRVKELGARISDLEDSSSVLASKLEDARAEAEATQDQLSSGLARVEVAERIRLEREWSELAGPAAPLPAGWDGTLGPALAVELELIREVVGTPSTLEVTGEVERAAALRMAMCAEFLRAAARDADEMKVLLAGDLVVWASSGTPDEAGGSPHLDAMKERAAQGGAHVTVEPGEGGFKATLRFGTD